MEGRGVGVLPQDADIADLLRAAETAQALARRHRLAVGTDRGLRERCFGVFEGLTFTEVEERRALFARLVGVDADGVALVPATSSGLAVAAANLTAGPGKRVGVVVTPTKVVSWDHRKLRS